MYERMNPDFGKFKYTYVFSTHLLNKAKKKDQLNMNFLYCY